jgi:hypothetical protein
MCRKVFASKPRILLGTIAEMNNRKRDATTAMNTMTDISTRGPINRFTSVGRLKTRSARAKK